jgi:hypothetical protein
MLSVKKSGAKFNTEQISIQALARGFGIRPPASLKTVIADVLVPQTRIFEHAVKTGNVTCDYTLIVGSNGLWTLSGTLRDSSHIMGDDYDISFKVGNGIELAHASGYLGSEATGGTTAPISGSGISEDLRTRWPEVLSMGVTVHLEATVNPVELTLDVLGAAVFLGLVIIFAISAGGGKKNCTKTYWTATPPQQPGDPSTVNFNIDTSQCPE